MICFRLMPIMVTRYIQLDEMSYYSQVNFFAMEHRDSYIPLIAVILKGRSNSRNGYQRPRCT